MPEHSAFRVLTQELAGALATAGFDAFVKLGQGPVPDQVFVSLEPDAEDRLLHAQLMFLPDLTTPAVLQYFVGLPYEVAKRAPATVARTLCRINVALPIAGFEYHEDAAMLFFRHNHAVSVTPLSPDVVVWALTLIEVAVTQFGPIIEAAAHGAPLPDVEARFQDLIADVDMWPGAPVG